MKKLYLILGIVLIALGLLVSIASPVVGIIAILIGIFTIVIRKKLVRDASGKWRIGEPRGKAPPTNKTVSIKKDNESYKQQNKFTFRVAGVTYDGRQNVIKEIVDDWKESNPDDLYEGMSNKEIKKECGNVAEVSVYDWCDMELIPEPKNKHDPNAIKIVTEFGAVGYVSAVDTKKVKQIIEGKYILSWEIVGGKYKHYDELEDKILTDTLDYGIEITLIY